MADDSFWNRLFTTKQERERVRRVKESVDELRRLHENNPCRPDDAEGESLEERREVARFRYQHYPRARRH